MPQAPAKGFAKSFKSYFLNAVYTSGNATNKSSAGRLTTTLSVKSAGLSSAPKAAGECVDMVKPVARVFKLLVVKGQKAATMTPNGTEVRVCWPCAAGLTRNVQTGVCSSQV